MALPGAVYLYQGEELGLPEVEIPVALIEDPMHLRSGGVDPGRDGCRVPFPWSGAEPPYGFSPEPVDTWLPQPDGWEPFTAKSESADPDSMLALYRSALRLRRDLADLGAGELEWLDLGDDVIAFRRGALLVSVTNFSPLPLELPPSEQMWLVSTPLEGGRLPADATAWLRPR
jgi:alpha-glucosidase